MALLAKPLVIAFGFLILTLIVETAYITRLLKQQGASAAKCEAAKLEDISQRNNLVYDLQIKAAQDQVAQLQFALARRDEMVKELNMRDTKRTKTLDDYRKQIDAARKADSGIDAPLADAARSRLRRLEDSYRVRPGRGGEAPADRGPTGTVEPALQ